jgi:hypothetical protein
LLFVNEILFLRVTLWHGSQLEQLCNFINPSILSVPLVLINT